MEIHLSYRAIDGYKLEESFSSIVDARKFAYKWVGESPELGSYYAVSSDGVGRLMWDGIEAKELFPSLFE